MLVPVVGPWPIAHEQGLAPFGRMKKPCDRAATSSIFIQVFITNKSEHVLPGILD